MEACTHIYRANIVHLYFLICQRHFSFLLTFYSIAFFHLIRFDACIIALFFAYFVFISQFLFLFAVFLLICIFHHTLDPFSFFDSSYLHTFHFSSLYFLFAIAIYFPLFISHSYSTFDAQFTFTFCHFPLCSNDGVDSLNFVELLSHI